MEMRRFSYFLFENFDPEEQAQNPQNPRRFLNASVDPILDRIAQEPPRSCPADAFSAGAVVPLLQGGILREEDGCLLFDTPVLLREDAPVLRKEMQARAERLTEELLPAALQLQACCQELGNGFPVEINLYHILCGMVFDGLFFDYLSRQNAVATSRLHHSGLDYLAVIYESCQELNEFSDGLLCSYNCFTDGICSLQSFGDCDGSRLDVYRVSRLLEAGQLPPRFERAGRLLEACPSKENLLAQVRQLVEKGTCEPEAMALLTEFGYAADGRLCVPVYTGAALQAAERIEKILEERIGSSFVQALSGVEGLTAVCHGVPEKELANEMYHILFGSVNEALAARGIVASPPRIPGEGRYLRCIQLETEKKEP